MTDALTFPAAFSSPVLDGETLTLEADGFTITATIHNDDDTGAPWDEHDGHGPVSGMTTRDKRPGELVLCSDVGRRFYDFAAACQIARRDGWGFMPYPVKVEAAPGAPPYAPRGGTVTAGPFSASDPTDFNRAIAAVYAEHKATMTPRAYAAAAALKDFEHLQAWCNDDWRWVGVAVTVSRAGVDLVDPYAVAVWGIDSESADHLTGTANDLIGQALAIARAKLAELAQ